MATIETTIQGNISSKSGSETDKFTFDFSKMHHATTDVFVIQISTDISKWKTSKCIVYFYLNDDFIHESFKTLS